MAIAHDALTRFPTTEDTADTTTGDRSFTHTPSGTPRGVVVVVCGGTGVVDAVTGVTYGGTAMSQVTDSPQLDTNEGTRVKVFFLGTSVPAGAQTVVLQRVASGTTQLFASCATLTAATATTAIEDTVGASSQTSTDPQLSLTTTVETQCYAGMGHGDTEPPATNANFNDLTNFQAMNYLDAGTKCWESQRSSSARPSGTVTMGYTYSTSDDWCMVCVAVREGVQTLERSASLTAGSQMASVPQRALLRQAAISASGAITSSGTFWTTFERSIAITASGSIASSGEVDAVGEFNRSASLDAVGSIVSAPQRDVLRQVAIAAAGVIQSAGSTSEILERSVALGATTAIASAGSVTSIGVSAIPERREVFASIAAEIELPNGTLLNFNPDEGPDQIPISASFDTEMPGGDSAASLTIARPEYINVSDLLYGSTRFYVYEANHTLHLGRIVGVSDNGTELGLEIEGWARHLQDDKTAREIFVDRDLTAWGEPSVQERIDSLAHGEGATGGAVIPDATTGEASLETGFDSPWSFSLLPNSSPVYWGAGIPLGSLYYAWKKSSTINVFDTHWFWQARLSPDDTFYLAPDLNQTGDLASSGPGTGTLTASGATKYFAMVELAHDSPNSADGVHYAIYWTCLAVYGTHGLTKRGTESAVLAKGFYVSDMYEYIVGRWAPLIEVGDIEATTFVVPHAVWKEPTTAQEMIETLAVFGGDGNYPLDWFVYSDPSGRPTFGAATPFEYGNVWHVRLDEGAEASDAGPDVQRMLNGVVVSYDDGSGTKLSVGPSGSGADYETAVLEDTDEGNPANRDGANHWEIVDAGITSGPTPDTVNPDNTGAVLIGRLILAERNRMEWRGDVTVKDAVRDDAGNWHSVAMMRSGDRLIIEDDPDLDFRERRIVNTKHENRVTSCSVGARPDRWDVLLARLGVVLVGRL